MKKLVMVFALVMALLMCFAAASAEETMELPDAYVHSLYADDSGEWLLDMQWFNNGQMFVSVEHRMSDNETDVWSITLENAFDGDVFDYNGAFKGHATMDSEDGSLGDLETLYEDGTGLISLNGEVLTWTDNMDGETHVMALLSTTTTVRYLDSVTGVAELSTTAVEDNSVLSCVIEWPMSETEARIWNLTLVWSDADNVYRYDDAECLRQVVSGEDFTLETVYTNGTGTFAMMSDGSLTWNDGTDGTGSGCRFVMSTVND